MVNGQLELLRTRRFLPLFVTQFLGALNDNVLKNALVVLLTFQAASWTSLSPGVLANLAAGIFILPFFLFSALAGQLADKFDKARIARLVKLIEIVIVLLAGMGFLAHSLALLLAALFLLGLHSTLFGPVKYAILPQHLVDEELVGGNALIEAGTFVAILLGTLLGGLLAAMTGATGAITVAGLAIAIIGYLASRAIPAAPPPMPQLVISLNPLAETWRIARYARTQRGIFPAILGISWFWLYGALFLAQFPAFTKLVLGGSEMVVILLLTVFTVGIGVGSLWCGRLSHRHVELGFVPLGAIGLTLFGLDFALASSGMSLAAESSGDLTLLGQFRFWRILCDLALIGISGGFYIVPLYTLLQQRSEISHRARVIAANNIFNALFMVGGAVAAMLLLGNGLSIPLLFAVAACGNAAVAFYLFGRAPAYAGRFAAGISAYGLRRLRVTGLEQLPATGPVWIECPDMTAGEMATLLSVLQRPVWHVVPDGAVPRRTMAPGGGGADTLLQVAAESSPALSDVLRAASVSAEPMALLAPEGAIPPEGVPHFRGALTKPARLFAPRCLDICKP